MVLRFLQLWLYLFSVSLIAVGQTDFKYIDNYVSNPRFLQYNDHEELAKSLTREFSQDSSKARAIYAWIAQNIRYDTKGFFSGTIVQRSPDDILLEKSAVCHGYTQLFQAMAQAVNIETYIVHGYSKGYKYSMTGDIEKQPDHAWVVMKIDNQWQLLDPTWAAGFIDESGKFVIKYKPQYFFTPPKVFILRHLPADPMWQLLNNPISLQVFKKEEKKIIAFLENDAFVFDYKDSIEGWVNLPPIEQNLKSARNEYHFKKDNPEVLGFAYMEYAYSLFVELGDNRNDLPARVLLEQEKSMLEIYELAAYYLKKSKHQKAKQALEICLQNISACKANIESLRKFLSQ